MATVTSSAVAKHQIKANATGVQCVVGNEVFVIPTGSMAFLVGLPNQAKVINAQFYAGKVGELAFGDRSLTARYAATISSSGVTTFSYVNGWGYTVSLSDDSTAKYYVCAYATSLTYSGTIKWRVEYIMDWQQS